MCCIQLITVLGKYTYNPFFERTSAEQEFDHLQVSLVAGQGQSALLELIRVGVDVSTILEEQLGHAYNDREGNERRRPPPSLSPLFLRL